MIVSTWHGTYSGKDAELASMHPNWSDVHSHPVHTAVVCSRHGLLGNGQVTGAVNGRLICEQCRGRLDWGVRPAPSVRVVTLVEVDESTGQPISVIEVPEVPESQEIKDAKARFDRLMDEAESNPDCVLDPDHPLSVVAARSNT